MDDTNEARRDDEWAWVAGVYHRLPARPPEEVKWAAADIVRAAARSRERRKAARRLLGIAAAAVVVLFGRWVIVAGLRRPEALVRAPSYPASPLSAVDTPTFRAQGRAAASDSRPDRMTAAVPQRDADLLAPKASIESGHPRGPASIATNPPTGTASDSGAAISGPGITTPPLARPSTAAPVVDVPGLAATDRVRLRAALGEEGLRSLATLVLRATEDGLPGTPLLDRAFAGVAYGAPASKILAAVERRAGALRQARATLGSDVTSDVLTAGADALETGAGPLQLAKVRRHFPPGRVAVGLLTLAGLVTEGVPASDAAEALATGADLGASDATLLAWRAGVAADVARGVPPLAALRARVREGR